jgi:flagellar biosynthesis GTPase FlhF
VRRSRQPKRLRKAITRRLGAGAGAGAGTPLDGAAAITIARDLALRGASEQLASVLVSEAAAHGSVFADGHSLRAGARAQLARRIVQPPPLPASGAAVAFVGAGGAGKTSCAAALASAYARTSTLAVSALSLRCPDGGRMLAELLRGDRAEVQAIAPLQAARAVRDRRSGGLTILDTAAVNPSDSAAVAALSAELEPLALDAIYVALPATLGPHAARSVVASFSALGATAIAITHADETDQIGVAVEIVAINLIPLAYVHAGTDPTTALNALDPKAIAARLVP